MKSNQVVLSLRLVVICLLYAANLAAQPSGSKMKGQASGFGYVYNGDSIEFIFGEQTVITIGTTEVNLEKRIAEVNRVNIAGDFNNWNPNLPGFQMKRVGKTVFKLSISKNSLGKKGDLRQFKFVLNGKYWVEPPVQAANKFTGGDKNTNLTLTL
jgi:hypothetical protein